MKEEFVSIDIVNNEAKKQFELHYNGTFAYITYEYEDGVWSLPHTISPDELKGTGAAGALVEKVFTFIQERGEKIIPICTYLIYYVNKHTHWKSLVVEGSEGVEE